jgi:hypothetical protein
VSSYILAARLLINSGISSIDSPLLIEEDFTGVAQSGEKTPEPEEFDPVLGC